MATKTKHAIIPNCTITLLLFKDVENAKEIRQSVINGEFEATLLKTSMILDPVQVLMAANKAIHAHQKGKMITKNVHTEIMFNLSPTKNISESFRKFGVSDTDTSVFVVIVNDLEDAVLQKVTSKLKGQQVDVKEVKDMCDENLVKKVYKLGEAECLVSSPLDSVLTRIAAKDIVTV